MSKPFDAITKYLVEKHPKSWAKLLELPEGVEVTVVDADLSTVTAEADSVLKFGGGKPYLGHIEFQGNTDDTLLLRLCQYNVIAGKKFGLPVWTIIVLLRPFAKHREITGWTEFTLPNGQCYLEFHYRVIRVWEIPVEQLIEGGIGTLALAPICNVREDELPGVIAKMQTRVKEELSPEEHGEFWTASWVLSGLKHSKDVARKLFQGVRQMRESVTYQAILEEGHQSGFEEGRFETSQKFLLRTGRRFLGDPDASIKESIHAIMDVTTLEYLADRVFDVKNWQELLALMESSNGRELTNGREA